MGHKQKGALLVAVLATLGSALAAGTIVGREVRAVELIALFAGGFGAGASVVAALCAARSARTSTGSAREAAGRSASPGET